MWYISSRLQHCKDWIKALAGFNVGSPVVIGGLTKLAALSKVPVLLRSVTKVQTESGLSWDRAMTVRQVLTKDGRVIIATGHDEDCMELETPTKVRGLVGAFFSKMWKHDDMKRRFTSYKTFGLVASNVVTVYNHASMTAGLYSRMSRRKYPDLRVSIVHDAISKRHKRAKQCWAQEQANKRP